MVLEQQEQPDPDCYGNAEHARIVMFSEALLVHVELQFFCGALEKLVVVIEHLSHPKSETQLPHAILSQYGVLHEDAVLSHIVIVVPDMHTPEGQVVVEH